VSDERRHRAFTLIELLIVVSIIALLAAILLPNLRRARDQARAVACRSNIRQLHLANSSYALENNDLYVPAASDMVNGFGGRHRWHGTRLADAVDPDPVRNTFDPELGPLAGALLDGAIKACPQRTEFVTSGAANAFEAGCGGYGYNLYGIGGRFYAAGWSAAQVGQGAPFQLGWWTSRVQNPAQVVMFTDTAYRVQSGPSGSYLIEYSFSEPPWSVEATPQGPHERAGEPALWWLSTPSIHFRHAGRTNVAWCDGHVSGEKLSTDKVGSRQWQLGWFGTLDNAAFAPVPTAHAATPD